jgi:hypothetical protein
LLTSKRFTEVLTDATRKRLLAVLDNTQPMSTREPVHSAVTTIQAALSDLNRDYLAEAEIDGYFGRHTAAGVERFQRDYGLVADGIVGRQTLSQLDELHSGEFFRDPQGASIHVGVNRLDVSHYGGEFPLAGCVNDARAMRDLADIMGYTSHMLTNEEATTSNFIAMVRQAASGLYAGDSLFVSFSGHGSQLESTSPDEEADLMDETLCFYDRMFIDNELFMLLHEVRAGVNVTLFFDSCHSGTVAKMILAPSNGGGNTALTDDLTRAITSTTEPLGGNAEVHDSRSFVPISSESLLATLDGDRPVLRDPRSITERSIAPSVRLLRETSNDRHLGNRKSITMFHQIYLNNREVYNTVRSLVQPREQEMLECNVISFSACQDNQTTLDGAVNGFFTGRFLQLWDRGNFSGSCRQLFRALRDTGRPDITPALNTYGTNRAKARLFDRAFRF